MSVVEDSPELLETYVRVRNPLNPASIVVSLMPQQSRTQYPASIANNVTDASHKTAKVFDKYYREKHLPHVQDEGITPVHILILGSVTSLKILAGR